MIGLPSGVKLFLFIEPTDLRKGYDSLAALARSAGHDPYSGHLFIFISRTKNRYKILFWERDGFVIQMKRLARGRFKIPPVLSNTTQLQIDAAQLTLLLEGIDFTRLQPKNRWKPRRNRIGTSND